MLRAVGMTRRQVRAMVRGGASSRRSSAPCSGSRWAWASRRSPRAPCPSGGVALSIPSTLAWFVVVAIAVGVLAAVMPARRAARLDVLRALQYE